MPHPLIEQIDRLIRRDPARRGLIGSEPQWGPLCQDHLEAAAAHLAESGKQVAVVSGFFVPDGELPAAETDGPLGALLLAGALERSGMQAFIITDEPCTRALRAAADVAGFPSAKVLTYPNDSSAWREQFFTEGPGHDLTHLVAIERVGPSHTPETFAGQTRQSTPPIEEFRRLVPTESYDRCHNMRGQIIDQYTADLHRLFEELPRFCPKARTIGIGDGGNEIGMGVIPWEDLTRRLGEPSARIACRVATDWNIVAGTSNWGAYALAAATLVLRDQIDLLREFDRDQQQHILEHLVQHGPAVDGATGRQEPTVDGLPFLTYIQPWEGIRRLLGFDG